MYAAALQIEQREAGPYSRATQSALRAFIVYAETDKAARNEAHAYYRNQYPHWYLVDIVVELVTPFGVSTEGAAWAAESGRA